MHHNKIHWTFIAALTFVLGSCIHMPNNIKSRTALSDKAALSNKSTAALSFKSKIVLSDFERNIAQRLMISIRYYCEDDIPANIVCQQPVTRLP